MTAEVKRIKCVESLSWRKPPAGSPYPSAFSRQDLLQSVAKFSFQQELRALLEPQRRRSREEAKRRDSKKGVRG